MELDEKYVFERSVQVKRLDSSPNTFTSEYPAWGFPHLSRISGSIPLTEAANAAYKTVPPGFDVHSLQAQFLKPGIHGERLIYEVQNLHTTSKFACRTIQAKQRGEVRVIVTISFFKTSLEENLPQPPHHYVPSPSPEGLAAAAQTLDPELEDFGPPNLLNVPPGTPYPPISNGRLSIHPKDGDIGSRIHRSKVRITSPLSSSPLAQILAVIFFSDMYAMNAILEVQDINFGLAKVGDRTRTRVDGGRLKQLATLNHSLHFVRLRGWDVGEGLLFESKARWARGRRGVGSITIRDCKGEVVATAEQEGFYNFASEEEAAKGKITWAQTSGGKGKGKGAEAKL